MTLGGFTMGKLREGAPATVLFDLPDADAAAAASFAMGMKLRGYRFDRYKSKKADKETEGPTRVTIRVERCRRREGRRRRAGRHRGWSLPRPHARERAAERAVSG